MQYTSLCNCISFRFGATYGISRYRPRKKNPCENPDKDRHEYKTGKIGLYTHGGFFLV